MTPFKLLAAIGVGIASIAAFNLGAMQLTTKVLLDMPAMEAQGEYFRIGQEAMRKYPKLSPLEARSTYSNELLIEHLEKAADDRARAILGAETFIGFWMLQGRARAEFCAEAGVDFASFRAAFEARNKNQHERAIALLSEQGTSEERLYEMFTQPMRDQVQYEMLYIKSGLPTERKAACDYLLSKRVEILPFLEFHRAVPAANRALMIYGRDR